MFSELPAGCLILMMHHGRFTRAKQLQSSVEPHGMKIYKVQLICENSARSMNELSTLFILIEDLVRGIGGVLIEAHGK